MQQLPNDIMGYDRAITVFSPDGRLLQVEYAKKTVEQGTAAIGITCADGVVLVADKRVTEALMVPDSRGKIVEIASHIGATASGLVSDGRILMEKAQLIAQKHSVTFNEPVSIIPLVREICDYKQMYTQYGGARPYGVSLLVAGVDSSGTRLFMTEPAGIYLEYKACAIGEGASMVNKILEKSYKDGLTCDEAIVIALKALKTVLKQKFLKERIEIAVIGTKDTKFRKVSEEELTKYLKRV